MGNDQIGRLDQSSQRLDIDELSFDHRIVDTRQPGDLGRDRPGRLLQAAINADDIADRAVIVEGKGDGADFDDLVAAVVETGGLRIENDAEPRKLRPSD